MTLAASVPSPGRGGRNLLSCAPTATTPTIYATGLVDLEAKVLIDMVQGNAAADLRRWTKNADAEWIAGIEVVATDLAESFRAGLSPKLDHATWVADRFHVVRVGNRCLDKVRRRVQNETLGHRGRKGRPALPHPQAPPGRRRAPRRQGPQPDAAGPAHRRSPH